MENKEFWYETHMHTLESSFCSVTEAKEHVRIYKKRGYTGIIITDHLSSKNFLGSSFKRGRPFTSWEDKVNYLMRGYEAAKEEGDKIGLDVFFGWEFFAGGHEFLTYGLDREFLLKYKDLDKVPIEEYSKIVRDNGGYLAQAHPYRAKDGAQTPVNSKLIDAVEIFNASRTHKEPENVKAITFAKELNLPIQAGTDAHKPDLRLYSGVMLEKRAENIFDIINAIKERKIEPILPLKEDRLWHGSIDTAREYAQLPEVSELLVKVIYDCKHARKVAEDLCSHIHEHTQFDAVCAHVDQAGQIENTGRIIKTIIIGHHDNAKNKIEHMQSLRYNQYGMKYGFNEDECVIVASKSALKRSKEDVSCFFVDFCKLLNEDPRNLYLRKAQFKYVAIEFMQNGLQEFLKVDEDEIEAKD